MAQASKPAATADHSYIYEVDLMRALTAFTVVAIHALSYTTFILTTPASLVFANLVSHALHYNRELFMFISALVLTYVYFDRKTLSLRSFWLKRFAVVFIPYVLWTVVYVIYNNRGQPLLGYLGLSLSNIATGNASSQLYYILLTLQFYAVFPLFLRFMKKVVRYPWQTLGISLAVQLLLIYIDFAFVQSGPLSTTTLGNFLNQFQNRFFLLYEFFFVLGGFTAVYFNVVQDFVSRHGRLIGLIMLGAIGAYAGYYYLAIGRLQQTIGLASTVLQPSVILYSTVAIVFVGWLAVRWARKRSGYPLVKALAEVSFGIYFVHILVLEFIMNHLFVYVPAGWPAAVKDLLVILSTFSVSAAGCYVVYRLPLLSWTIGRMRPLGVRFWHRHPQAKPDTPLTATSGS